MSSSRFANVRITRLKLDGQGGDEVDTPRINFISQTARGSNDYKHKTHLIYLTNLFPDPQIEKILRTKSGSENPVINSDAFALSKEKEYEMLYFRPPNVKLDISFLNSRIRIL